MRSRPKGLHYEWSGRESTDNHQSITQLPDYPITQFSDPTEINMSKKPKATKSAPKAKPSSKARKYVYFFGSGKADGNRNMKDLLGGKGSGLAEMTNAGLPVPPGFTITTEVC